MEHKLAEMEESTNRLFELEGSAEAILAKLCEKKGVDLACVKQTMSVLYDACVYSIEAIRASFEALQESIVNDVTPAIHALAENLKPLFGDDLFFMVPPHIKHLAYNHPKSRVRNKNWNRMWKIHERYMKCHKN